MSSVKGVTELRVCGTVAGVEGNKRGATNEGMCTH